MRTSWSSCTGVAAALLLTGCAGDADAFRQWPQYRGDLAGTGFSPLAEITAANVSTLRRAWSYSLESEEAGARGPRSQATPIMIDDRLYLPAADRIVALDPVSGAELWSHEVVEGSPSRRGVAYWPGAADEGPRIIFTAGDRLVALDADSGTPAPGFGEGGEVELGVPYNSVPLVFEDLVVVGANTPRGQIGGIGNARAYDARTGRKVWEFSSVPKPGSVGHATWEGDSWEGRLGVNAWPFYFTVDAERGLLYLPLAAPIPYWYGGDRPGANLFGNSVVAVDVRTGEYRWHFQTIHHDLWDHDPPAPPALFDAPLDGGGTVPALALTTKSGYVYLLNRETGEPLFGVEERPVPPSDVPGEAAYPTQPIPVNPPPASRVSYDPADLVSADDTSPEHAAACAALVERVGDIYNAGAFTPWAYRGPGMPERTTLLFPGLLGGHNWGGAAFDRITDYVFVFSRDVGSFGWVEDAPGAEPVPFRRGSPRPGNFDVDMGGSRWPCQKPPWGRLTAIDSRTGDIAWQVPIGVTDELPPDRRNTGRPGRAAAIATGGGVLFIASTDDDRFRALEAATGQELWVDDLEARGNANPMTYGGADGRQYVVIVATDRVIAYRLP
ncbi:MAG: PQQ-binding-like beta-propeller repeat protein [Gemmatimonadota bacterium]|jgi:quinoprotein glucose dehydrogenase